MDLTVHDCDAVRIDHHMPNNRNCVTLRIDRTDGEPLRISMFGLPADVTAQLVAALGRPRLVSDIPQVSGAA